MDYIKLEIILKEVRTKKGYSVRQLAYLSGISKTHISAIENRNVMPSVLTLYQLAKALKIHPKDLVKCEEALGKNNI